MATSKSNDVVEKLTSVALSLPSEPSNSLGSDLNFAPVAPVTEGSVTLAEQLFQKLMDAIIRGELRPGSRISEPAIAQLYGVSRGPLREALQRLQERKLITRSANYSARVIARTSQAMSELFIIREALEGVATREAVLRCSDSDLDALRATVIRFEAELPNLPELEPYILDSADEDFHFLIAKISQNPLLITLLCSELYPLLRFFRGKANGTAARRRQAVLEHKRILSAMEERDAELSEMLMRRHIAAACRSREAIMSYEAV
jgi:DNA-binding GntR family transcriptional regulator